MADACTVRRQNGTTRDPESGLDVLAYDDVYVGVCKVQASTTLAAVAQEVGGAVVTQTTLRVDVPISAPEVEVGDLVDLTASLDAQLVGKTFRVSSRFGKTYPTARRLEVKEL